jgi:hypothetical protein
LIDALDPKILTQPIWQELLGIWERHFATDLPFIHPPTFSDLLRQTKPAPPAQDFNSPRPDLASLSPPIAPEFLLAFIALTCRFSPELVSHHPPKSPSPLIAADYYARACVRRITSSDDQFGPHTTINLDRVQTYLILAVYEWSNCNGKTAWSYLNQAIIQAQMLGLASGNISKLSKLSVVRPLPASTSVSSALDQEMVLKETKKRTFWSCFILERLLSSGDFRPTIFNLQQIKVTLPVSQHSFVFNRAVRTRFITEQFDASKYLPGAASTSPIASSDNGYDPNSIDESGANEAILSRYLKATEVYHAIIEWSCAGGRLNETYAPWEERSTWHSLYRAVNSTLDQLPRDLTLTQTNISAHNSSGTLTPFTLLHTILLLSKIILHREWLPFLPVKHLGPKGPTDDDSPFQSVAAPASGPFPFWDQSASELFRTCKSLLELLTTCHDTKVLPETPLVGFASYMIALMGKRNFIFIPIIY